MVIRIVNMIWLLYRKLDVFTRVQELYETVREHVVPSVIRSELECFSVVLQQYVFILVYFIPNFVSDPEEQSYGFQMAKCIPSSVQVR